MSAATPTLASALAAILAGDVIHIRDLTSATHDDLRQAGATLPTLWLSRASVARAIRNWRSGICSDSQLNTWAWFVRRGAVPDPGDTKPLSPLEIHYDREHEDLLVAIVGRLSELGDLVDGQLGDAELDRILLDLET